MTLPGARGPRRCALWQVVTTCRHEVPASPGHCVGAGFDFVVTASVKRRGRTSSSRLFRWRRCCRRQHPELTQRIRRALQLCVVEGMSAELAADEMGLSPHTVRSYIKEGYRILETYDDTVYPPDMSPQERAFMRFTALEDREPSTPDEDAPDAGS